MEDGFLVDRAEGLEPVPGFHDRVGPIVDFAKDCLGVQPLKHLLDEIRGEKSHDLRHPSARRGQTSPGIVGESYCRSIEGLSLFTLLVRRRSLFVKPCKIIIINYPDDGKVKIRDEGIFCVDGIEDPPADSVSFLPIELD
jgi:hypothetical protein